MSELADLLKDLIEEIQGLRTDLGEFRQEIVNSIEALPDNIGLEAVTGGLLSAKTLSDVVDAVEAATSAIEAVPEDIGDRVTGAIMGRGGMTLEDLAHRITGGLSGVGGSNLDDISDKLGSIEHTLSLVEINTSA